MGRLRSLLLTNLIHLVAHRLRTVIDYDRLIILDKGEVCAPFSNNVIYIYDLFFLKKKQIVEFDTPFKLIQKEGGVFRSMCLKSGTFAELEAAARAKAEE